MSSNSTDHPSKEREDAPVFRDSFNKNSFRNPVRTGIAAILILIALGQISGRILSMNSVNMISQEQTLRNDLLTELKFLAVQADEEGNLEDLGVYSDALQEEFQFSSAELLGSENDREAAKTAHQRLSRKGPVQSRRDNWDSRRREITTEALLKKVVAETKYRHADLIAELRYLAVLANEAGNGEEAQLYLSFLPDLSAKLENSPTDATLSLEDLANNELVTAIKKRKEQATHHWPIDLRKRDSQRISERYSTQAIVDIVRKEVNKQRPFLSGNDRSRWLSVRSLVELGTFEINGIIEYEPSWDSVDVVSHMNANGEQKLYSSKPPLQSVIAAVPYWLIHKTTGWDLGKNTFEVGRILLFILSVLPLGFGWWCCARILDDWCENDLTFAAILAAVCFATTLTTFATTFNNHIWGAVCALAASMYAIRCWRGSQRWSDFAATGFWAAMTFTCELPAASLVAMFGALLLFRAPKLTLAAGTPAVLVVLLAYFGTNYLAHGKWSPPYSFGAGDVNTLDSRERENWYDYDYVRYFDGRKVDSYWRSPNNPLDLGEPDLGKYVLHATVGHHGIFSLTPILLLAIPGLAVTCLSRRADQRSWGIAVLVISLACVVFYLFLLDTRQRNYGGMTSSFRQLMWLHPIWMIATIPIVDKLFKNRWGVLLFGFLAAMSALAASYPHWNPWSQTWIWNGIVWLGGSPLSR